MERLSSALNNTDKRLSVHYSCRLPTAEKLANIPPFSAGGITMHIGEAARQSGVSAKMIRYYEQSGLIPAAVRRASGYRDYTPQDVHRLRFVRRARDLGFSVEHIAELLSLWGDREKGDTEIHSVTSTHIEQLRHKAQQIERMIAVLEDLAHRRQHDEIPECPILEESSEEVGCSDMKTTSSVRLENLSELETRRHGV